MIVRAVTRLDEPLVLDLWLRNGLVPHSRANDWAWLWGENPVRPSEWTWGWVVEDAGRVRGYIGNLPLRYHCNGRELLVACARGYVVDQDARQYSMKLAAAFFLQNGVDLFMLSSANDASAPVYKLYKALPLPVEGHADHLMWFPGGYRSVRFLLSKWRGGRFNAFKPAFLFLGAPLFYFIVALRRLGVESYSAQWSGDIVVMPPGSVDARWDRLFEAMCGRRTDEMFGDRSSRVLRWHYSLIERGEPRSIFLAALHKNELFGYLVLSRNGGAPEDHGRFLVSDIFVLDDDASVLDALLERAFLEVRKRKGGMIEAFGFPIAVRRRLLAKRPFIRKSRAGRFWYKTPDASLASILKDDAVWYVTPYDGDSSL